MTVPDGFSVQLVASEPQLMNPVAMCIDDQGRFWVTESFEYPRRAPGPGRDRIKVLEDTDRDGVVDKVTVFAEGLNIPSGIQVGHGGVWIANAPDLLLLKDTDGDLKADETIRVLTGFGRTDTHELPNAFTWGPDGYLYGLNGVFNYCSVRYTKENPNYRADQPAWDFTCALWRLDPRTLEFEVFAQGTSNPWGIAINPQGDFFLSACVIDHLWHISETGYYVRQGGPYPAHTWPMPSIVQHKHQKAAYCGIVHLDSDAYPPEYSNAFYMGNVHAGCLNVDVVEDRGASYFGKPREDFLTANDVWFMPVAQVVGPDGCLYVLDWYDRYHCYQDANADPEGVDRGHGRLYRVRYNETPPAPAFDLQAESNAQLLKRLEDPNVFWRQHAQRVLSERSDPALAASLAAIVNNGSKPARLRNHALWAWISGPHRDVESLLKWCDDSSPTIAAWSVRALGDTFANQPAVKAKLQQLAYRDDLDPKTRLQTIIATGKTDLSAIDKLDVFSHCLQRSDNDSTITHLVWNATLPLAQSAPDACVDRLRLAIGDSDVQALLPRLLSVLCDAPEQRMGAIERLVRASLATELPVAFRLAMVNELAKQTRQGAFGPAQRASLRDVARDGMSDLIEAGSAEAVLLSAMWGDEAAQRMSAKMFANQSLRSNLRIEALRTLAFADSPELLSSLGGVLESADAKPQFLGAVIEGLGGAGNAEIADLLLRRYDNLPPDIQPKVIERLTQRAPWTRALLQQIAEEKVPSHALNLNQLRRIVAFDNEPIRELLNQTYGTVREAQRGDRQQVIETISKQLATAKGDPFAGQAAFKKVCGQCHQMYGEGFAVGPDITRNGRNDWKQLLQNVFDPSAVIGPGYQARTVVTVDGRVLTGLAIEESEQRVVLKLQGGTQETIARDDIETYRVNQVSLMPEELEKQLTPQELADLFAYLALDKHPSDPSAKRLPGAP